MHDDGTIASPVPHVDTFPTFVLTVVVFWAFWFAKGLFEALHEGIAPTAGAIHESRQRSGIVIIVDNRHGGGGGGGVGDNRGQAAEKLKTSNYVLGYDPKEKMAF